MKKNIQFKAPLKKVIIEYTSYYGGKDTGILYIRAMSSRHLADQISSYIFKKYRAWSFESTLPNLDIISSRERTSASFSCRKPIHPPSAITSNELVYFHNTNFEFSRAYATIFNMDSNLCEKE